MRKVEYLQKLSNIFKTCYLFGILIGIQWVLLLRVMTQLFVMIWIVNKYAFTHVRTAPVKSAYFTMDYYAFLWTALSIFPEYSSLLSFFMFYCGYGVQIGVKGGNGVKYILRFIYVRLKVILYNERFSQL